MKKFARTATTAIAMTAALSATAPSFAGEKTLLKTPVAFGTHLPALGTPIKWVSEQLPVMSGNKLKMKIYEPGKLVAPPEILDAVSSGKINSGYATAGYWQGKMPAAALFSAVPFGPEAGEYLGWIYYGNGLSLYQEMYDNAGYNVKVLPCAIISPDMRFFGLGASVMEKLGAGTVQLPGGEIFGALEKGAIDATEFSQPAIDQRLGLHKIAKYNYFPGWHQQSTVFELLVNKDTWNDMSKANQAILENTCKASMTNAIAEGESMQFEVMKKAQENGVEIRYWNEEMLSTFKKTWDEVVAEKSQDAFFNKVYTDLSNYRDGYDLWEAHAFLPRPKPSM
jgi:TRAP-type mannitol/chloroaromatic compound transport system substrate-binding protein